MTTPEPAQRLVPVGEIELCVQAFGDPDDPPILLVYGAAGSMDWWDEDLCARIADGGRRVLRYDHRDTGQSTTDPPGDPSYDAGQLDRDCVGLIEALGLTGAHLVGLSMGGSIAQAAALTHPDRVLTLTLMSTSPVGGVDNASLPGVTGAVARLFEDPPTDPDWADRDAVVEWFLASERAFAGDVPLDEARVRRIAGRVWDRSTDVAAAGNHWLTVGGDDGDDLDVRKIAAATLVIHGTDDPMFPIVHGEVLAEAIPDARLLRLEGYGHQVPPRETWDAVVPALLEHTGRG